MNPLAKKKILKNKKNSNKMKDIADVIMNVDFSFILCKSLEENIPRLSKTVKSIMKGIEGEKKIFFSKNVFSSYFSRRAN